MPQPISAILRETRDYYLQRKRELCGAILTRTGGHIVVKRGYAYLRKPVSGSYRDIYLGPESGPLTARLAGEIAGRVRLLKELARVRAAMKELRMPASDITREDYFPVIRDVFEAFERQGLWESGLELVGSWCFKVYQSACGVDYSPERTLDVDFALRLPYRGNPADIAQLLKDLGFTEEINYADSSVVFKSSALKIEFIKERKGDGRRRGLGKEYVPELGVTPQALPYLGILLEHPVELKVRGLGRVVVPSMPAFALHKLIVAGLRREDAKREKDLRQAGAVARAILRSREMVAQAGELGRSFPEKWLSRSRAGVESAASVTPECLPALEELFVRAGLRGPE